MRSNKAGVSVRSVGVLVSGLFVIFAFFSDAPMAMEATPECDIHTATCQKSIGNRSVELDIQPKPVTAMKDSTFRVTISGAPLTDPPYIDLGMPGMKMGPNRVTLKNTGPTTFEGTGVIVRCKSGKRIWRATITLPDIGTADFTFDVVY